MPDTLAKDVPVIDQMSTMQATIDDLETKLTIAQADYDASLADVEKNLPALRDAYNTALEKHAKLLRVKALVEGAALTPPAPVAANVPVSF